MSKFLLKSISFILSSLTVATLPVAAQTIPSPTPVSVLTQHNDNARTGANLQESILTPANVNVGQFGKLFTRTLDANVNGQVLYVPNLVIHGVKRNVIFAYTSNNSDGSPCSVYAFDADNPGAASPIWRHHLPSSAQWTTCAPVIDAATHTIYVVTKSITNSGTTFLRALDLLTGVEKPGSPIALEACVRGNGDGSSGNTVCFDTTQANCRPALLLLNGLIYMAFAHNSDSFPYHGWIFGYRYDGQKFTQASKFCTNPNGGLDGIWQAGQGLAADTSGHIYCSVSNGTFDVAHGSYGMCYLKLNAPALTVANWFAPFDEQGVSDQDLDLGNSGPILLPGTNRLFGGGTKFGSSFLLNTANLGHFTPGGPDHVVQRFNNLMPNDSVGQNPICWDAGAVKYVYLWANGQRLQQFRYETALARFNPAGVWKLTPGANAGGAGGSLGLTAQGATHGILWAVGNDNVVRALDATDVTRPAFWTSQQNAARDSLNSVGHFQFPTIVNGKVYVPTGNGQIVVYGLLAGTVR